jgi:hypothetical protein
MCAPAARFSAPPLVGSAIEVTARVFQTNKEPTMERIRVVSRKLACSLATLALLAGAGQARAAVGLTTDGGWQLSFEGFVNAFGVDEMGSKTPVGAAADPLLNSSNQNEFRVRTGLLPGLFAFNVGAPKVDGLDIKARVGLYPQINNASSRNAFGAQIDLREIYFTVDGGFGQVLLGRALNLYQGRNILTDMTLFGVGVNGGAVAPGGTTLGRIGYGYLYAQFGAQLRYTTPSISGVKLAVAIVDPSHIMGGVTATDTRTPGFESELSYAGTVGPAKLQAWLSGLYQQATVPATATAAAQDKTAAGGAAGVGAGFGALDLLASGFVGKGLGTFLLLDVDSLDAAGEARKTRGFLLQAGYTFATATKIGVSYGENILDETRSETAARAAGQDSTLSARKSITGGLYHDLTKNVKLVAEYTHAMADWHGGQSQSSDIVAAGGFFLW